MQVTGWKGTHTPGHNSSHQLKDNPKTVALQPLDETCSQYVLKQKARTASLQMANTWSTQLSEDTRRPMCCKFCTDNRKHIWATEPKATHVVSSGGKKAQWAKPRSRYTSGFCPSMNCLSFSARHSAFFSTSHSPPLPHHKRFGGNHREALIPFPKITSARGKGQGGGAWGHFAKVSNILAPTPLKEIMKGRQASFSFSH